MLTRDENFSDAERWKLTQTLKFLDSAKGNGTSNISLLIAPSQQISAVRSKLNAEMSTAERIKCRENRQSVVTALTATQSCLAQYKATPANGLAVFCGTALTDNQFIQRV